MEIPILSLECSCKIHCERHFKARINKIIVKVNSRGYFCAQHIVKHGGMCTHFLTTAFYSLTSVYLQFVLQNFSGCARVFCWIRITEQVWLAISLLTFAAYNFRSNVITWRQWEENYGINNHLFWMFSVAFLRESGPNSDFCYSIP